MMKKIILVGLSIMLVITGCGKQQPEKDSDDEGRSLASVTQDESKQEVPLPISTKKFLLNQEQRLKPQQAIKNYSKILPQHMYQKLLKLSHNVDDLGFSVTRKDNVMILENGKESLKIGLVGPIDHLSMVLDGKRYDFEQAQSVNELLEHLETQINGSIKTSGLPSLFFNICPALGILSFSEASFATNWFLLGGLAIVGVAIAYAAYTLGKSVKKTDHTVNVKGEVSLDQKSKDAIADLADAVRNAEVDVNVDTNHNIKVDTENIKGIF